MKKFCLLLMLMLMFFPLILARDANGQACDISIEVCVTLSWVSPIASDLKGFIVYYGIASRAYDTEVDVSNVNNYTLSLPMVSATYFFAVAAYDNSGNISTFSNEKSKIISTENPSVFIVFPSGNISTNSSTLTISGTASTNTNLVKWENNQTGSGMATGTTNWSASIPFSIEGVNKITVTAVREYGLTSSAIVDITYDATSPEVSIAGGIFTISTPITGTISDNIIGVDLSTVVLKINGEPVNVNIVDNTISYLPTGGWLPRQTIVGFLSSCDVLNNCSNYGWNFTIIDNLTTCQPPMLGDWLIVEDCQLPINYTLFGDIIISNALLRIKSGVLLSINFSQYVLGITNGGTIFIEQGGNIVSVE